MNLFDLAATLKLNTSQFENGIKSAKMSANAFAKEMTKGTLNFSGISQGLINIGTNMKNVGKAMTTFGNNVTKVGKAASVVTVGVATVLGTAFSKAKSFIGTYESAMTVFTRKLEGGKEAADDLYDGLVTIAKGSSFAQEHMVSAGQTLVAMGLNADKTKKYIQAATDAIAGFGGSGADVEEMSTLFAKISQQTNLYTMDIQQMVERGIPAWDILATKYHTTTDAVKDMARNGLLPASESLDTITGALEESDKSSEMFKYSVQGLAKELKSGTLMGTLDSLNTSFRTFSLRLLDLDPRTDSGKQNIQKLNKAISEFGKVLENIGTKFGQIVGKDLVNGLDAVTRILEKFNNALDNMSPEQAEAVVHAIEAIALAGPALLIVGKTISSLGGAVKSIGGLFEWLGGLLGKGGVSGAINSLVSACGGASSALGIFAGVVVGVIGIAVSLKRHWKDVVKYISKFNLGETFSRLGKSISDLFGKFSKLGDLFEVIGDILIAVLLPSFESMMITIGILVQALDGAITVTSGLIDILGGLGELIIGIFTGDGKKIKKSWEDIWQGCGEVLQGFVKSVLGVLDSSGLLSGLLFEPLASSTVQFSDTVSEESQRAVQAYMDLDREATIELNKLLWSSDNVTEETKKTVCDKYDKMKDYVVGKITEQKDESIKVLQDMVNESSTLSEDEKSTIIETTTKTYDERVQKVTDGNNRIKEIMNTAKDEKRQITEDEKKEIVKIQNDMKEGCVKAVSKSAEEQEAILRELQLNVGSLSVEQCSTVIQQSAKQRDQTINDAEKEYRERLKAAKDLRQQGGEENVKLADKIEEEAKRQYETSVENAKNTHNDVVGEAQKQAEEHGALVDGETGRIKSAWETTCEKVGQWFSTLGTNLSIWLGTAGANISQWFTNIGPTISGWMSGIGETISGWWNGLCSNIRTWGQTIWSTVQNTWNNIGMAIGTPIQNAFGTVSRWVERIKSVVTDKFNAVKSSVMSIWNGITSTIQNAMNNAANTVSDIINRIKGFFNFNISWPHIPLPHFSVSPAGWQIGDLLQGSIPSLSISWHAKGGIFTKPTLFETANGLHGVGEAGAEAVLPIKLLKDYVREAMAEGVREANILYKDSASAKANVGLVNGLISAIGNGENQTINLVVDGKTLASVMYDPFNSVVQQRGGKRYA